MLHCRFPLLFPAWALVACGGISTSDRRASDRDGAGGRSGDSLEQSSGGSAVVSSGGSVVVSSGGAGMTSSGGNSSATGGAWTATGGAWIATGGALTATGGAWMAGGGGTEPDAPLSPEEAAVFCAETCEPRIEDVCATTYVCNEIACDDPATSWAKVERDAFVACTEVENLCYFNLEWCMFDEVHAPDEYPRTVRLEFEDVDGMDGTFVYVRGDSQGEHAILSVEIQGEPMVGEWFPVYDKFPWNGINAWFDVDGDGVCEESDEFAWVMPRSNRDPDDLIYSGTMSPVTSNPSQTCDLFP